jgi:cephalosporin hydroxylase
MQTINIVDQLQHILETAALTEEQKRTIERVIVILQNKHTKEALIDAAKILASLLSAASHFF